MRYLLFINVLITTCFINSAYSQDSKRKNKDFFQIKAPAIEYSSLDTSEILFEEEFVDTSEASRSVFYPHKELNLLNEDTTSEEDGELSIVEVSEQLSVDSIWVTIAEYYAIWDSRSINPYKIDHTKFSDTLNLPLFDTIAGYKWSMPLVACNRTSQFGMRHTRWHYGIDLGLSMGDPVLSAFDGIVRISHYDRGGYGNYVLIRHYNGLETLYGHLTKPNVEIGQLVKAGEVIGIGGNTGRSSGPHLHFEVRYEGNAIDPENLFDFENNLLKGNVFTLTPEHFEYLKSARKVVYHKVRSGETLYSISRKYRVSVSVICRLNGLSKRSTLRAGRKLRIR